MYDSCRFDILCVDLFSFSVPLRVCIRFRVGCDRPDAGGVGSPQLKPRPRPTLGSFRGSPDSPREDGEMPNRSPRSLNAAEAASPPSTGTPRSVILFDKFSSIPPKFGWSLIVFFSPQNFRPLCCPTSSGRRESWAVPMRLRRPAPAQNQVRPCDYFSSHLNRPSHPACTADKNIFASLRGMPKGGVMVAPLFSRPPGTLALYLSIYLSHLLCIRNSSQSSSRSRPPQRSRPRLPRSRLLRKVCLSHMPLTTHAPPTPTSLTAIPPLCVELCVCMIWIAIRVLEELYWYVTLTYARQISGR